MKHLRKAEYVRLVTKLKDKITLITVFGNTIIAGIIITTFLYCTSQLVVILHILGE